MRPAGPAPMMAIFGRADGDGAMELLYDICILVSPFSFLFFLMGMVRLTNLSR